MVVVKANLTRFAEGRRVVRDQHLSSSSAALDTDGAAKLLAHAFRLCRGQGSPNAHLFSGYGGGYKGGVLTPLQFSESKGQSQSVYHRPRRLEGENWDVF